MIYGAFEAQSAVLDVMRPFATMMAATLRLPWPDWPGATPSLSARGHLPSAAARLDTFAALRMRATRPAFDIQPVLVGNKLAAVQEEVVARTPFMSLLRFRKDSEVPQPRLLVVAPMSGHYATLLRPTVQTLLIDHDVYVTDWHNIRDVPRAAGTFDMSTYVAAVIAALRALGAGCHLVAVCQPVVPALAAAALMAEDGDPAQPRSLTLMGGPVDARINPTKVNALANSKPIEWFERTLCDRVPASHGGAGRSVYPGFMQLVAFIAMNRARHEKAFADMADALARGDLATYRAIESFYDEYFAVMDLSADFYLQTVRQVFQTYDLARGVLDVAGRRVDLRAIRRTALLTVEGERDDICGLGQTMAAQELCSGVRAYRRTHHVQTGVGHYGIFAGRRWVTEVYPKLRDTVAMAA